MSTTSPSPSPTGGTSSATSRPDSDTATLYLFTFLATILILVLLSASLVLRSYVLRRRYRQHLQQALADGLFAELDPAGHFDPAFRRAARRLGPKPILWDTWMHPADKFDSWSSIDPVAVRCSPPTLSPITSPSTAPPPSPSSIQTQSRLNLFPQLRIPSPLFLSPRPTITLPVQGQSPLRSPTLSSTKSISTLPPTNDTASLAVCVLIAMPDPSAPAYRPPPDTKGKAVDSLESPVHQPIGDADPLLPSTSRPPPRTPGGDEGLPLIEFGVVEATTGDWVWAS